MSGFFYQGASGSTAYIASQAPLPHTVNDFWRMIWECEVQVILMACNEIESGRVSIISCLILCNIHSSVFRSPFLSDPNVGEGASWGRGVTGPFFLKKKVFRLPNLTYVEPRIYNLYSRPTTICHIT